MFLLGFVSCLMRAMFWQSIPLPPLYYPFHIWLCWKRRGMSAIYYPQPFGCTATCNSSSFVCLRISALLRYAHINTRLPETRN